MSLFMWVCAGMVAVLVGLAVWQSIGARRKAAPLASMLDDARRTGSATPLNQHPLVDELRCIGCGTCVASCPERDVLAVVKGIARIVHGSRCLGHGRCEEECPVGAITIGLGALASSPDIPRLNDTQESTVPGLFIAGDLAGVSLIRNAIRQGAATVDQIARRCKASPSAPGGELLDLIIVGAGPAGLSASLRAHQLGIHYLTLEQNDIGGTVRKYPRGKLTMTEPVELPLHGRMKKRQYAKEELVELWDSIVAEHGLKIRTGVQLLACRNEGSGFTLQTSVGVFRSRFVLMALGRRGTPRKLGVPGEELEKVLYELADAQQYTNQGVLVVGGGDSAIEAATGLANQLGNKVVLSYRKEDFFRLKDRNAERLAAYERSKKVRVLRSSEVLEVKPGSVRLRWNRPGGGKEVFEVQNDRVFIFAGGQPPYPILRETGVSFGDA